MPWMVSGFLMQRMYSASASGAKKLGPLVGLGKLAPDEEFGVGAHHLFRGRIGLHHEEPVPREHAPLPRHVVEQVVLRQHVEERGPQHPVGVVEAHAVQHAGAAVVAGGMEPGKAECCITST